MLVIVTGTIQPESNIGHLIVRDTKERLQQYVDGIQFLIESKAFSKIVFCENSGYGTRELEVLESKAHRENIQLELLSFVGNKEQMIIHGKGYGEGEIMQYVFEHSQLVKDEKTFVKITGRMKIINIKKIVSCLKDGKTYFNIPNRTIREFYDTRIYAMPTEQFRNNFLHKYVEVMDEEGHYLEHVYTEILKENMISVRNFPRYPRIVGISGSTGSVYTYTEWKCRIKDVIGLFGGYRVQ